MERNVPLARILLDLCSLSVNGVDSLVLLSYEDTHLWISSKTITEYENEGYIRH